MNNKRLRILGLVGIGRSLGIAIEKHIAEEKDGIAPSCISCEHFDEPKEHCNKFNVRPPARIIALGCEHYKDNDPIPF